MTLNLTAHHFWLRFELHNWTITNLIKNILGTLNDVRFMVFKTPLFDNFSVFLFRIHIILPQLKLVSLDFWELIEYGIIETLGLTLLDHLLLVKSLLVG